VQSSAINRDMQIKVTVRCCGFFPRGCVHWVFRSLKNCSRNVRNPQGKNPRHKTVGFVCRYLYLLHLLHSRGQLIWIDRAQDKVAGTMAWPLTEGVRVRTWSEAVTVEAHRASPSLTIAQCYRCSVIHGCVHFWALIGRQCQMECIACIAWCLNICELE